MQFVSSVLSAALALCTVVNASPFALEKRNGAGSTVTSTNGLKWYRASQTVGTAGRDPPNTYICYSGPARNFPGPAKWVNFNTMFSNAVQYALTPIGDTSAQINQIKTSILAVSKDAKVDARVILATVLLESTGNVNVPCSESFGGVRNCGLMQSYNGTAYNKNHSAKSIRKMIVDGTQGTAYGPGLVQLFNDADGTPKQANGNAYKVFREYNSGSVNQSNLSDGRGASDAYCSNMANYLQGWNGYGNGPSDCDFS